MCSHRGLWGQSAVPQLQFHPVLFSGIIIEACCMCVFGTKGGDSLWFPDKCQRAEDSLFIKDESVWSVKSWLINRWLFPPCVMRNNFHKLISFIYGTDVCRSYRLLAENFVCVDKMGTDENEYDLRACEGRAENETNADEFWKALKEENVRAWGANPFYFIFWPRSLRRKGGGKNPERIDDIIDIGGCVKKGWENTYALYELSHENKTRVSLQAFLVI